MIDPKTIEEHLSEGFNHELGIHLLEIKDSFALAEIDIEKKHLNPYGIVHGGCIFTLMDTVGGIAARTQGDAVTTSSSNITFLNPANDAKKLIARAEKIKNGKNLLIYDVVTTDEKGILIAKSTLTYFRLP